MNSQSLELRKKLNSSKIYFRDIMPTKQVSTARLSTYTSTDVNLKEFNGKLYDDPYFGQEMTTAKILYTVVKGDWMIDEDIDDFGENPIVKLIDNKSGQVIEFAFPDQTNKLIFLNEMNATQEIKQQHSGMNIGEVVNKNLPPKKKTLAKVGIAAVLTGIGLLAFSKKSKKD